jgi:hypothetical protein
MYENVHRRYINMYHGVVSFASSGHVVLVAVVTNTSSSFSWCSLEDSPLNITGAAS